MRDSHVTLVLGACSYYISPYESLHMPCSKHATTMCVHAHGHLWCGSSRHFVTPTFIWSVYLGLVIIGRPPTRLSKSPLPWQQTGQMSDKTISRRGIGSKVGLQHNPCYTSQTLTTIVNRLTLRRHDNLYWLSTISVDVKMFLGV